MKNIPNPLVDIDLQREFRGHPDSGLTSMVSWENTLLWVALESFFGTKSNEKLIGINVDEHGITARFAFKKKA